MGAWILIAGVLLLGHTPALAESYIKVWEKGVVYYYFPIRENQQPRQAGVMAPSRQRVQPSAALPQAQAFIQKMDQPQNLHPWVIKAVTRMEANRRLKAPSPKGVPGLGQLRLGKANDLPAVNSPDPTENIWTGPRYLGRLLAIIGYRSPLTSTAVNPGSRQLDHDQAPNNSQQIQDVVRNVCHNFLTSAQEQHPQLAQVKPGADPLAESNQLGYCFPVAQPYSFRDTWGDSRSGGRVHHAVDIFAWEGTPVYAVTSGVIYTLNSGPESGISLFLGGQDGRGYGYMHLQGYAEGIVEGKTVKQGELIAYVGRTGIRDSAAHLHLQVYVDHRFSRDELLNPYGLLVQLCNGQGVTDLMHPNLAHRRIPAVKVIDFGTVRLSDSVPGKYQSRLPKGPDAPTWVINKY
jgi:murein DD-endopeptidase MepM/ murein hydrolase activator NlpD